MKKALVAVILVVCFVVTPSFVSAGTDEINGSIYVNLDRAIEIRKKMDDLCKILESVLSFSKKGGSTNLPDYIRTDLVKAQNLKNEIDDLQLISMEELIKIKNLKFFADLEIPELETHKLIISEDDKIEIHYDQLKSNILFMQRVVIGLTMLVDRLHNVPVPFEEVETFCDIIIELNSQKQMLNGVPVVYLAK